MNVEVVAMFRGKFIYFVDCTQCGLSVDVTLDPQQAETLKIDHLIWHDTIPAPFPTHWEG